MKAEIFAIGTELLMGELTDTNSAWLAARLPALGVDLQGVSILGDDLAMLTEGLTRALQRADLVLTTGGLGPTQDDITRDAVGRVLQLPLDVNEAVVDRIRERFARRGLTMSEINRRQAMVPRGAALVDNPNGTAPGLWLEHGSTSIVLLPGPPREMTPMLETVIRDRLAPKAGGAGVFRRVLKLTGRTESDVDAHVQPIYSRWLAQTVPISTTILAVAGQIELHLTAGAGSRAEADAVLAPAVLQLEGALGDAVYSVDGRTLEAVVGELLRAKQLTIAVAESCTGGLLASRLTDVPGSSDYVDRGAVCYSDRAKIEWLGVPESLIAEYGAVSEPVARAMAEGVRSRAGTKVGIGITGIAGPGGGTPQKPVGTVAISVLVGDADRGRTFQFVGGRELVKFQATQGALNMLRLMLR